MPNCHQTWIKQNTRKINYQKKEQITQRSNSNTSSAAQLSVENQHLKLKVIINSFLDIMQLFLQV